MASLTDRNDDGPYVQGVSLRRIATYPGPFLTVFLPVPDADGGRSHVDSVAAVTADVGPEVAPLVAILLEALRDRPVPDDIEAGAHVACTESVTSFWFREPLRRPLCRFGRYPSLGAILEEHQLVVPHVVVTVEGGRFGVTTFGSQGVPDAEPRSIGVADSLDALVEELRFAPPRLLALAGSDEAMRPVAETMQSAFPAMRISLHPHVDLDGELSDLADEVVRDAASLAAEDVAHELGVFRAAEAEGLAVEGPDVLDAVQRGEVVSALVHDDADDTRTVDGDRLVDAVVATAVVSSVRVTMMPDIDERRGPEGGLGAVIGRGPQAVALGADQVDLTEQRRDVPQPRTASA